MTHKYNIFHWSIRSMMGLFMFVSFFTFTDINAQVQDPVWTINAPTSNWFGTGNTERGLGLNHTTGNLIVASRQGGVTPILIDAATGDGWYAKNDSFSKENAKNRWIVLVARIPNTD